jgi:hypothetical protein
MNFTTRQWVLSIVLDMLIKIVIITYLGLFFSLSAAPIAGFVCLAVFLSAFHFVCLFLGCTFAVSFELFHIQLPRPLSFVLVLMVANILFVAGFAGFFGLSDSGWNNPPAFYSGLIVGLCLTVTNLIPVLTVAACGRIGHLMPSR